MLMIGYDNKVIINQLKQHKAYKIWKSIYQYYPKHVVGHPKHIKKNIPWRIMTDGFYLSSECLFFYMNENKKISPLFETFDKPHFVYKQVGKTATIINKETKTKEFVIVGEVARLVRGKVTLVNQDKTFLPFSKEKHEEDDTSALVFKLLRQKKGVGFISDKLKIPKTTVEYIKQRRTI